jgi:hypothetical protein
MRHLIAPSSMLVVMPTSIHPSSQKGMRTHHQRMSRSRRDTPSLGAAIVGRDLTPSNDDLIVTPSPDAMARLWWLHAAAGELAETPRRFLRIRRRHAVSNRP